MTEDRETAIQAVLKLHTPYTFAALETHDTLYDEVENHALYSDDGELVVSTLIWTSCPECDPAGFHEYSEENPCPTVRTIRDILGT